MLNIYDLFIFLIIVLLLIFLYQLFFIIKEPFDENKKKVAICMRGAIGKINKNFEKMNELYSDDNFVDYEKCYRTIIKHIINANPNYSFDFFCHCWNPELEENILQLYNPKKYLFEDNRKYNDYINSFCEEDNEFTCVSQALSMKKSIELKENYENEKNINYDIVILYRYDILLWKDILLDTYKNNNSIYVNGATHSDFHFIMNNNNSNNFKYLIDSIKNGNRCFTHYYIEKYITNYMNIELIADDIIPGHNQEVLRKIKEYSIDKGHLTQEHYDSL